MPEQSGGKLICPLCRREYRWRRDLAGQSVRCRCGQVLTMPHDPLADPADEAWVSDVVVESAEAAAVEPAIDPACPWCGQTMPDDVTVCVHCGYDRTTGKPFEH